jgi:hypothetical protein
VERCVRPETGRAVSSSVFFFLSAAFFLGFFLLLLCPRRFSASGSLGPRVGPRARTSQVFRLSFFRVLLSVFLLFCVAASGVSLPACSLQFFRQSLPFFSPIFPPATRPARLISAFRSFLSAHQSSVYPQYGEHRLRQAAQRFSPCSCLAPFAPSRLPCCLGLSCSPLTRLLSFSCLLLSSSLLIFF